jgi:response regulator RpfG family c-di-GMP phosphodiesterase
MTAPDTSAHGPTVLCVDDEPNVLAALHRVLHRHGCNVVTATTGPLALDILKSSPIEILICDEAMPEMRGIEVLRQAREISPSTVRILLTAHCQEPDVVIPAVNEGEIFRLLAKPWDDEGLIRTVREALGVEPGEWSSREQRVLDRLAGK